MRVLFIGNSYTYYNQLPDLVALLAASRGGRPEIVTDSVTQGGVTLEWHWNNPETLAAIRRGGWDWVVMQEQSTRAVRERHMTFRFANKLAQEICAVGARPMLYCSWAREHIPEMLEPLSLAYGALGTELCAPVAPVGKAFAAARERLPDVGLYTADHSHPSPEGSYLAVCVFYATLTGKTPEGLARSLALGDKMLVDLDSDVAVELQGVAWETCTAELS